MDIFPFSFPLPFFPVEAAIEQTPEKDGQVERVRGFPFLSPPKDKRAPSLPPLWARASRLAGISNTQSSFLCWFPPREFLFLFSVEDRAAPSSPFPFSSFFFPRRRGRIRFSGPSSLFLIDEVPRRLSPSLPFFQTAAPTASASSLAPIPTVLFFQR